MTLQNRSRIESVGINILCNTNW